MSNEKMSNEQLVTRIRAGEDTDGSLMLQLWEQNRGLIGKLAGQYRGLADEEDLKQEGYFGLCEAVEHWEAGRGAVFSSVLFQYVRSAMLRYCQNNGTIRIPIWAGERAWKYEKLRGAFRQQVGREPTDKELCCYLGVGMEMLGRIKKDVSMSRIGNLDTPVGKDEDTSLGDLMASDMDIEGSILEEIQCEQLRAVIWPMVDALPGKQAAVIRLRYQEGLTLKETGERLGFNHQAAREHERNGFRELRRSHRARILRPFLPEVAEAAAYHGNGVGTFNRTWTSSTERAALKL